MNTVETTQFKENTPWLMHLLLSVGLSNSHSFILALIEHLLPARPCAKWSKQSFYCILPMNDLECSPLTMILALQRVPCTSRQNSLPIAMTGWLILLLSLLWSPSKVYAEKLVEYFCCWLFLQPILSSSGSVALMPGHPWFLSQTLNNSSSIRIDVEISCSWFFN